MSDNTLVLGPLLRYVDETSAAIWVEVAARGPVSAVLAPAGGARGPAGARAGTEAGIEAGEGDERRYDAHTFTVHGHHYALIEIDDLSPGTTHTYEIRAEDHTLWPPPRSPYPPSRIRTLDRDRRQRVLFGSCRTSVPHDADSNRTHGIDILRAYALQLPRIDAAEWPDLVLFMGDQVYADETSEEMQEFIAGRRDIDQPPYEELQDYEEYAYLYRLAWTDPANRWLLSTLPSAMIFDDHDVRDDWNTSIAWRDEINRHTWWRDRVVGALGSYWVYQHLGNLSPDERGKDPLWAEVRRAGRDGDAGDIVDDFANRSDLDATHTRWSFCRDLGNSRVVVLDTRAARVLEEGGRKMLDDGEMAWFESLATGGVDHLFVASSLPFMLPMGLHHLEAWSESVAGGAWGRRLAEVGEKVRQGVDLEHWAAFQRSFQHVGDVVRAVARGERGPAPATVTFLGGDVHHHYLAEARPIRGRTDVVRLARWRGAEAGERGRGESRVLQVVCSPIRNPLPRVIRFATAASAYGLAWPMGLLAARSARVPDPPFRWSLIQGPWFENAVATVDVDGRRARIRWYTAEGGEHHTDPQLVTLSSATLS